ncbi:MAG: diphthine--ammonia ligase [Clostridium sp.]|uniref:Dph6-related ATP pyrophosphatase n=1 Tax=Clostridium sp. TaxID=1506 RepID=UPI002FCBAB99
MRKFAISYSCGKDSTLALYRMIKEGNIPIALIVNFYEDDTRSWLHGVNEDLLNKISSSLNIPLIKSKHNKSSYGQEFEKSLIKARQMGADCCVFGDIDIEEHRTWCSDRCMASEIECIHPLWQENRKKLAYEFVDLGFKAIIKAVSKQHKLNPIILGRPLTRSEIDFIEKCGADPCGENGEYHTFVYDGPLFNKKIIFNQGKVVNTEYSYAINIW